MDGRLSHRQVMQNPDTWAISGEFDGVEVRGLSLEPDAITAELYDRSHASRPLLGKVGLHRSQDNKQWMGLDQLRVMIDGRDIS